MTTTRRLEVLITAEEAFPALEAAFLDAEHDIVAGFRIFDPETHLRSDRAKAVGGTWADLMLHTLNRGVDVTVLIGDFDPINATSLHQGTWHSMRILQGVRDETGHGAGQLTLHAVLHPARIGLIPRLIFAVMARRKLRERLTETTIDGVDCSNVVPGLKQWCETNVIPLTPRRFAVPHQFPASHHHKLAVFDRKRLYIGGLDLNNRRYDTQRHDQPAQHTWHDVQVMVNDPELAQAGHRYLSALPETVKGAQPPPAVPGFLRTLSQRRRFNLSHISPRSNVREIRAAHLDHIGKAERFIYLETQFFRDRHIARALCRAAKRSPRLTLVLILPGAPEDVAFHGSGALEARFGENLQARCITQIRNAFGTRLFVGSPVQPRAVSTLDADTDRAHLSGAPLIYVHAKVSIFDDQAAIVSSANLNGRSLNWDSEAGVILDRPDDIAEVKRKVMGHWLPDEAGARYYACDTAQTEWTLWAKQNDRAAPQDARGFIVPYRVAPALKFGTSVPGVPEAMV